MICLRFSGSVARLCFVVQLVEHRVLVAAVVRRVAFGRQELVHVEVRLDDVAALEVHRNLEVALAQRRVVRRGLDHLLLHVQADAAPLVDQPDAQRLVRHRDAAIRERELEAVGHAGFLQQPPRLGARFFDVGPVAGELVQLLRRRRERRAGHLHAGHRLDDRDLGERLRRLVPVQRERQRAAHALVVEWLLLVVDGDHQDAIPGRLLHRDLVAERADDAVALRRAEAAELDMRALAAHRSYLRRRIAHEDRAEAVEVRLALVPVVRVLLADDVRALDVLDERERPGSHDVLLVPVHVLREDVGLVDEVVGRQERRDERARLLFQLEHDGQRVRCFDRGDIRVLALAGRADAGGREDDLVVGGLYVFRRHVRAVVELDALAQLERIGQPVVRSRPAFGQRRRGLGPGLVVRVDPQQRVVERRDRVDQAECFLAVSVIRRRLRRDREHEFAAVLGSLGLAAKTKSALAHERQHTRKSIHDNTSS